MSSAVLSQLPIARTHKLGILFLISGLWTLSLLDTAGKLLALAGYHVVMIAWMRYTINLFFMAATLAPLYRRRHGRSILQSNRLGLQLGRGALLLGSTLIFFSVLKIVPLAEGTAMNFCAPLIVLAISPWLLGERSYLSRWIAVLVGFTGMLIVIRPSGDIPPYGVALGLISALTQALLSILNRKASQADNPMVTLFYGALVGSVVSTLLVPFFWTSHTPTMVELAILVSTGITSTIGHFLQNSAYRHAEASVLTPFFYAQIISACGMGWLVFGQFPDRVTVLGIAIICASGIGIAYIEHKRAHPLPPADPMESV
ncbi:DMT family transporter [Herbaspirillum seropedicae]|uniref:Permease of the drug/metabolite transporter (DMT) superfamily protein n=1 Tax=Herbaspirillum seropedicae (strain SmR1) TaxID=757424 RepID=D8IU75_HERSS|nr:DMT family transporter [Herbaspirillum seropedicae]ADJ63737.1 permease of the drug/metabolite transporter (DMT) superfamily protein [Herbaspirillum seropedicae SmR1]AKN65752.1 multidrug DMT transporter permease [Herbaspirillum seropedicae]NQE28908.1 multidrug DMT transporter permease [Herbaspirillum seropedicae]UMU21714.1 DMT family transporter [Herbaspirillum seropedicae]